MAGATPTMYEFRVSELSGMVGFGMKEKENTSTLILIRRPVCSPFGCLHSRSRYGIVRLLRLTRGISDVEA